MQNQSVKGIFGDACQFLEVLNKYLAVPGAVISGGYVRDTFLGLKPKDIDVFVPYQGTMTSTATSVFLDACHQAGLDFKTTVLPEYAEVPEVSHVAEFSHPRFGIPVQVVMLRAGHDPLRRHNDFGLCQCALWITPAGISQFDCTDAFLEDVKNKTLTLVDCDSVEEFERSMRRAKRFVGANGDGKFSDYRVVVPAEFQHFAHESHMRDQYLLDQQLELP